VNLNYLKLEEYQDLALGILYSGRQVLLMPPGRQLTIPPGFKPADSGLDLLVLPATMTEAPDLSVTLGRLHARRLLVYGGKVDTSLAKTGVPCHFTREGAVSVYLTATALRVQQWGGEKNQ
jgi:hypothetical protein